MENINKIKSEIEKQKAELLIIQYEVLDIMSRKEYGNEFGILGKKEKFEIALKTIKGEKDE